MTTVAAANALTIISSDAGRRRTGLVIVVLAALGVGLWLTARRRARRRRPQRSVRSSEREGAHYG